MCNDGRMLGEENSNTEYIIRPGNFVLFCRRKHYLQNMGLQKNEAKAD